MTIPLTHGFAALIDAADYELLSRYSWCVDKRPNGLCYANTTIGRRTVRMHELLFPDAKPERDHRNGDGLDNRRSNIRPATRSQNSHNTRKKIGAVYKGVTFQPRLVSRPWQSRIGSVHIGYFATAEEAATAYDAAALSQRGEYARTNGLAAKITPNHRYKVTQRRFMPNPKGRGRILEYSLACGHTHSVLAFRAPKIGKHSHCQTCTEAKK